MNDLHVLHDFHLAEEGTKARTRSWNKKRFYQTSSELVRHGKQFVSDSLEKLFHNTSFKLLLHGRDEAAIHKHKRRSQIMVIFVHILFNNKKCHQMLREGSKSPLVFVLL